MHIHVLLAEPHSESSERTYHVVQDSKTFEYSMYSLATNENSRSREPSESGSVRGHTPQPDMQESNKEYLASLNHHQVCLLVLHCQCRVYTCTFCTRLDS